MNGCEKFIQHYGETLIDMTIFKTLDIRGLPFFSSYERTLKAIREVKIDGVLELILDSKKNFVQAYKKWARSEGYHATDMDDGNQTIRLFIRKLKSPSK